MKTTIPPLILCLIAVTLVSCSGTGEYVGRRSFVEKHHYWGMLRRPDQPWSRAQLVVMDETRGVTTPDRLPEAPANGLRHGYDHGREYRVFGTFSGRKVYDPNANVELPVFVPRKFEALSPRFGQAMP